MIDSTSSSRSGRGRPAQAPRKRHPWNLAPASLAMALLLADPFAAAAQNPFSPTPAAPQEDTAGTGEVQRPGDPPSVFEIPTRARMLADSATAAEGRITLLGPDGVATELAEAARQRAELEALLASMARTDFIRLDRLSRLRDQALLVDGRLEELRDDLGQGLTALSELRGEWARRQGQWRSWRETLSTEPEFAGVESDVDDAQRRIEVVLARASTLASELLALQQRVEEVRAETQGISAAVSSIRAQRRDALLDRTEPVLLSGAHRAQLADGLEAWDPTEAIRPSAYLAFLRGQAGMLLFQVLLALSVGLAAARLARAVESEDRWGGLLEHPWLLGIFVSVVVAMQRVSIAPPLWDIVLWTLFGAIGAALARRLFEVRALRLTVYLLAALYPLVLVLEVAQLPSAAFRLAVAAVAALATPAFIVLGRRRTAAAAAAESSDPRRIWPLRIGAALWGTVLIAVVLGYDALGRWLLHATVMTAAVVFVVVLVFAFARTALVTLARLAQAASALRGGGLLVLQRVVALLRLAMVIAAALVLLDVWGLAEAPLVTWNRLIDAGFSVGSVRVTLGGVLVAILVVYGSMLVSKVMRSVMLSDVGGAKGWDRGVSESISKLAQYVLVTVGIIMGLAVVGVELQNFAIVAGALGIGIGFGLQNVVSNFASGLILLFERPVRVGDTVVVDEVWGTISKIGLRSTTMVALDQSEMIVPNLDFVSEKVTNWTLSSPIARVSVPVGVAYGSPVAELLVILGEAASAHDSVLQDPPPQVLFTGFGDSSLDFELRVWVRNIRLRLEVQSKLLIEIDRSLREAGIEIPFPQRDLHLRSIDPALLEHWTKGKQGP